MVLFSEKVHINSMVININCGVLVHLLSSRVVQLLGQCKGTRSTAIESLLCSLWSCLFLPGSPSLPIWYRSASVNVHLALITEVGIKGSHAFGSIL